MGRDVTTARFLFALSGAMELATPSLARHQTRVAYIVWRLAEAAGLDPAARDDLFLSALVHDVGCLSPEDKLFIHEQALSPRELARHCRFGARLLADSPVLGRLAPYVAEHHARWRPDAPALAPGHLLHVAELFEHLLAPDVYILAQRARIVERLREVAPPLAGPRALELFLDVAAPEAFWLELIDPELPAWLAGEAPYGRQPLDDEAMWSLGETFRGVIDFRSHFTATHSAGVTEAATELAARFDFAPDERRWMRLAGCLHDVGKMAVPNAILEKPGPLRADEMDVMRRHTFHTARILGRAGVRRSAIEWAAFHHERLDGAGYPFRIDADGLGLGARLMTVADIFTALTEDRPYRPGLPRPRVLDLLGGLARGGKVDAGVVDRLARDYDDIHAATARAQDAARRHYLADFDDAAAAG